MHQAYGLVSLRRARASGAKQSGYGPTFLFLNSLVLHRVSHLVPLLLRTPPYIFSKDLRSATR